MSDEQSEQSVQEDIDPLALFPEQWRTPVEGLMYLGQLSDTVEFCGHTFGLKTLLPQDRFAIANAMQPYRNTVMEVDAFQTAHLGMALTSIDNDEDFCPPIGPDIDSFARARLNWVSKRFYPPTIDFLWARWSFLEATAAQAIKELDRLSKGSQSQLPSWLGSMIEQGNLPDEMRSAIQPYIPSNED